MAGEQQAAAVVDALLDAEALIGKLRKSMPNRMTWQRQWHGQLEAVDGLLQVLRMAIVMERPASELSRAATQLGEQMRAPGLAIAGYFRLVAAAR